MAQVFRRAARASDGRTAFSRRREGTQAWLLRRYSGENAPPRVSPRPREEVRRGSVEPDRRLPTGRFKPWSTGPDTPGSPRVLSRRDKTRVR